MVSDVKVYLISHHSFGFVGFFGGGTPRNALKNNSWWDWRSFGMHESNLGWLNAWQEPCPLYYCSGPLIICHFDKLFILGIFKILHIFYLWFYSIPYSF